LRYVRAQRKTLEKKQNFIKPDIDSARPLTKNIYALWGLTRLL